MLAAASFMAENDKTLLIVDDSEIDRTILKNIFWKEYDIMEADSGFAAVEIILEQADSLDAVFLDISMPALDGFDVLQIMKENDIRNIPVFLITSEATKDNVEKGAQFNICEFIRKPFERDDILKRLRLRLGIISDYNLTEADIKETKRYISDLKVVYNSYLANAGLDKGHYMRITDLMEFFLDEYSRVTKKGALSAEQIDIISNAGYFCDIGNMVMPAEMVKKNETDREDRRVHTVSGADIIQLNYSESCRYFVQICADICIHHHERYDGTGFPHRIAGENNLVYTQICRLADRFDRIFSKFRNHGEMQFDYAAKEFRQDKGVVSEEVLSLLTNCKWDIIRYYSSSDNEQTYGDKGRKR